MLRKKSILLFILMISCLLVGRDAFAVPVLLSGETNKFTLTSYEQRIDNEDGFISTGDEYWGIFRVETLSDLSGENVFFDGTSTSGPEMTGYFEGLVVTKVTENSPVLNSTNEWELKYDITFDFNASRLFLYWDDGTGVSGLWNPLDIGEIADKSDGAVDRATDGVRLLEAQWTSMSDATTTYIWENTSWNLDSSYMDGTLDVFDGDYPYSDNQPLFWWGDKPEDGQDIRYYGTNEPSPITGWEVKSLVEDPIEGVANVVPEPCTILLLSSGLIGLAGFRRKKNLKK